MVYGYARESTHKQDLKTQIVAIEENYPTAKIFSEVMTGSTIEGRKELDKLLKVVKSGDTIVFFQVSRMSRNAEEGFNLYQDLFNKGINLIFLKDHTADSDVFKKAIDEKVALTGTDVDCIIEGINKYLFILAKAQIKHAFEVAEKELEDNHIRTQTALRIKGASGTKENPNPYAKDPDGIGSISKARTGITYETAKAKERKGKIYKWSKDFQGSMTDQEIMESLQMKSRGTYYKYKRELKERK